jgi:hypothetical protein
MEDIKKALKIRKSALGRLYKEYSNYLLEKSKYNLDASIDPDVLKKSKMFYDETESALSAVRRSIEQYREQVYCYLEQYKEQLKEPELGEELTSLNETLKKMNELLPEEAAP